MATPAPDTLDPSTLVMKYCFLCDQAGPHYTAVLGEELVFQCHTCFATHADRVRAAAGVVTAGSAGPRHRA